MVLVNRVATTCLLFVALSTPVLVSPASAAPAPASREASQARVAAPSIVVDKTEAAFGDGLVFSVKVPKAAKARTVTLQERVTVVEGRPEWYDVQTVKASKQVVLSATVIERYQAQYRAVVSYRASAKALASAPVLVTVVAPVVAVPTA